MPCRMRIELVVGGWRGTQRALPRPRESVKRKRIGKDLQIDQRPGLKRGFMGVGMRAQGWERRRAELEGKSQLPKSKRKRLKKLQILQERLGIRRGGTLGTSRAEGRE